MKKRVYTEEEKQYIRNTYRNNKQSKVKIMKDLNLRETQVEYLVQKLELTRSINRGKRKIWNTKEIEYLKENIGKLEISTIANYLSRSYSSVLTKMQEEGISRRTRVDWYTTVEVAEILGTRREWVTNKIILGKIKASKREDGIFKNGIKNTEYKISREALKNFIRTYPRDLEGLRINMVHFVDALVGVRYNNDKYN